MWIKLYTEVFHSNLPLVFTQNKQLKISNPQFHNFLCIDFCKYCHYYFFYPQPTGQISSFTPLIHLLITLVDIFFSSLCFSSFFFFWIMWIIVIKNFFLFFLWKTFVKNAKLVLAIYF